MSYELEDFYKYIAPDVQGCPIPTVEDAVRDAIREFCHRSNYWRMWLEDTIYVSEDDETVDLEIPANTRLVNVLAIQAVNDDGSYGDYMDKDEFLYPGLDSTQKILFNTPAEEDFEARVRVSLKPDIDTDTVQDWVYEDFRDIIVSGALSRLLNMSSKSWYRQAEAMAHKYRFDSAVSKALSVAAMESVSKLAPKKTGYI